MRHYLPYASALTRLLCLRGGGSIADPSLQLMLQSIGFKNVIELDALGTIESDELAIKALPFLGEHGDLDLRSKAAWFVRSDETTMLFAADSNNLDPALYDLLRKAVDRKKDQTRRLNGSDCEKGLKVVKSLGSTEVYVYAMGAEP